jgi:hypothetical protein
MGNRHLGTESVRGFIRVPWPAASKKAFIAEDQAKGYQKASRKTALADR